VSWNFGDGNEEGGARMDENPVGGQVAARLSQWYVDYVKVYAKDSK